jgi:hypothetical protein
VPTQRWIGASHLVSDRGTAIAYGTELTGRLGGRTRIAGNPTSLDPNRLILTGENPFIRLSGTNGWAITINARFWRILISPAGAGDVLSLKSPSFASDLWNPFSRRASLASIIWNLAP